MSDCQVAGCERPGKTRGLCGAHAERARVGRPLDGSPIRPRGVDFEALVRTGPSCWEWLGAISHDGYGTYNRARVHRLMYERYVGPIPTGLVIDHLCRNRACCNPAHLEPVTLAENSLRGCSPGVISFRTGVCKRGHQMTPENTYTRREGTRMCRACQRIRESRRRR